MPSATTRRQRGASLVEVLVSITVFSVGLLGLLGMHATSMSFFGDAKYRADAALLADALISQVWVDRAHIAEYALGGGNTSRSDAWAAQVQDTLPGGDASVAIDGNTLRVTVNWRPAGAAQDRQHVAVATVQGP